MIKLSLCPLCKHLQNNSCKAYPNGIPTEFAVGEQLHIETRGDDDGIIFEPADNETAKMAFALINQRNLKKQAV